MKQKAGGESSRAKVARLASVNEKGLQLMKTCVLPLVGVAGLSLAAFAETVNWNRPVSGNWSDSPWSPNHPPTAADTFGQTAGTYTITNDTGRDLALHSLGSNVTGVRSLDLDGHRLTITGRGPMGNYAQTKSDGMRFLNGTLDCTGGAFPLLGANGYLGNGLWWISTGGTYIGTASASGESIVRVDGGGCWRLTGDLTFPNVTIHKESIGACYDGGQVIVTGVCNECLTPVVGFEW